MPISERKKYEHAMTGEGVGVPDSDRGKRSAEFAEKNFVRLLIFFACCFFPGGPLVPIETLSKRFPCSSALNLALAI